MLQDLDTLLAVTKDERFVTARHCLQAIWKVGAAGAEQQKKVVDGLAARFQECITEKNCTLIRYDIIQGLRNLYEEVRDEKIREKALELIETEEDVKSQEVCGCMESQVKQLCIGALSIFRKSALARSEIGPQQFSDRF